jgi:thiamine phosphate synthase YjbQ (UPF0047 family)
MTRSSCTTKKKKKKKKTQDLADALDRLAPEGDKFNYRHDDEVRPEVCFD